MWFFRLAGERKASFDVQLKLPNMVICLINGNSRLIRFKLVLKVFLKVFKCKLAKGRYYG